MKEKFTFSPEQTLAVTATSSVIVSAGAGSGKTTLMIERMLKMMAQGVSADRMLAVTFTSVQADDMRSKLADRLAECLESELDPTERVRLRSCYYHLPYAEICTLHKFCGNVVRKYFYLADVGADFKITKETDAALQRGLAVQSVFEHECLQDDPAFLALSDALAEHRKSSALAKAIWSVSDLMDTLADPDSVRTVSAQQNADAFIDGYRRILLSSIKKLLYDYAERCRKKNMLYFTEYAFAYADFVGEHFGSSLAGAPRFEAKRAYKNDFDEEKQAAEKEFIVLRTEIRKCSERIERALNAPVTEQVMANELWRLVDATRARYEELKRADGALDFNDLEHRCLRVLQDDAARQEIQSKYAAVFVDEYQDINPIQQAILDAIDSHRTFYVGDVKQSIYAFRRCDPTIFLRRYDEMKQTGDAVDLNENYRSARGILRFCDHVFDQIMTTDLGGIDYRGTARFKPTISDVEPIGTTLLLLRPLKEETEAASSKVYRVSEDEGGESIDQGRYAEGVEIAEKIAGCMRDMRVKDGVNPNGRALKYSDIAVLLRAMRGSTALTDALRNCGVPLAVKTDCNLFEAVHVCALADLLRVICNPRQDYPLVAVMKKFYDFTDSELSLIRLNHRGSRDAGEFFRAVEAYDVVDGITEKIKRMRAHLEELRENAAVLSPSELLNAAVAETDYFSKVLSTEDGATEYTLVRRFLQATRESVYNTDVATFLEYLDAEPDFQVEVTVGGADAVTVTTIHKAKGLEYEVVFVADMGKQFNKSDEKTKVFVSGEFGVVLHDYDGEERSASSNRLTEVSSIAQRFRVRQEEVRLLYVALTRAKRKLFLVGKSSGQVKHTGGLLATLNAQSPLEVVLSTLREDETETEPYKTGEGRMRAVYRLPTGELYDVEKIDVAPSARADVVPAMGAVDYALVEQICARLDAKYPFALNVAKTTATELNSAARPMGLKKEYNKLVGDAEATEVGTSYHAVMQHVDFARFTADYAKESLADLVANGSVTARQASLVDPDKIATAAAVLSLWQNDGVLRELPFLCKLESETLYGQSGDGILVQGIADLLVRDGDGYILIDYKTTAADEDALRLEYALQMAIYRDALTRSGYAIKCVLIYSFAHDKLVEMPFSTVSDAAAALKRV